MTNKQIFKEMFDNAVHVGHRAQKWNPKMKKFLYGDMNGVHIINLEKTAVYLEEALNFINKISSEGKNVLFVSTKPQAIALVEEVAKSVNMPYVTYRWIPGLLTNFPTVKSRIKYFRELKEAEAAGDFEKYTKKEAGSLKKTIAKLEASLGGVQNLTREPDVVFVLDVVRDSIAVKEAKRLGIPVVGITDSNADPDSVDFPIPANDDSLKSLKYLLGKLTGVIKAPKKSA